MSLTNAELQQFNEEGYVVKPSVFSTEALQPIRDALSEIVDTEAQRLQSEGALDDSYPGEPFGNRLGRISKSNLDAAIEITKGVMGSGGGGFSGESMFGMLTHPPLTLLRRKSYRSHHYRCFGVSYSPKTAGMGTR